MNIALWIIQVLLAALFMFSGAMKLITPIEEMTRQMTMPGAFLRFLGVAEILGGLGLILPGLLRQTAPVNGRRIGLGYRCGLRWGRGQ